MHDKKSNIPAPPFKALFKHPALLLGFGFGSGLLKPGPGTWGTLLGTLLFIPILMWNETAAWSLFVLSLVFGSWICGKAADMVGVHDHGGIVWDEFSGVWLVLLLLPEQTPLMWLLAFIVFRVFDIFKPWPINWADSKVHGGTGIMLDDILAGLMAIGFIWAGTMSFNLLF
ncbi:MAG: phosphatidylglycerophosphatase A [Pseudomonadota bacterium]|nr:phosphatidylglycerophosphatase A [Pseudomonadota bacterium]